MAVSKKVQHIPSRTHEEDVTTPLTEAAEDAIAYGMAPPIAESLRRTLSVDPLRIARAQIKVLEQALKFADERERQLRDRLKYYSAHYSEGGSGEYVSNPEAMNRYEGTS